MKTEKSQTFSSYYQEYFEKVYNYIYFRVGNSQELAEEFTQDVFLKALEHFDSFDRDSSFKTWIYKIAQNYIIDHYRKKKHVICDIEELKDSINVSKSAKDSFVKEIDEKFEFEKVEEALKVLPDKQQELIVLRYVNEYEIEEIEKITGEEGNYIRVNLHRGLHKLQSLLKK